MVAKAPIALAVDDVVSMMKPELRVAGFRKKTRGWWKETPETFSAVQVRTHWVNHGVTGKFTAEFGFSYLSLGEPHPANMNASHCKHRFRIGFLMPKPHDKWWRF